MADGISLGSLWNRSGHSGHPGANISRSLSVERTDRAEYSIFKVQKVLFTIHSKYEIFFVGWHSFFRVACKPAAVQRGLGRAPQICVWISKRYASKTICQQVGGFWAPLSSQSVEKPAGRVNHAMIHSLPTFPVHSEKVNHSMIHFFRKATAYTRTGRESMPEDGTPQGSETRSPREAGE